MIGAGGDGGAAGPTESESQVKREPNSTAAKAPMEKRRMDARCRIGWGAGLVAGGLKLAGRRRGRDV